METQSQFLKPINIKQVFKEKNPALARYIPGFIYRYLKKIVHENDINEFLERHGTKLNVDFINAALEDYNVKLNVKGVDSLPETGHLLFVSNHPLGGFDGLLLMKTIFEKYGSCKVLINDILMNLANIRGMFIPINKHGRQASDFARTINEAYASDEQLMTFPAGMVSRKINGQIMDLKWQKSFIQKCVQYKRTVIPTFVTGNNSQFFYRLANIRKTLGIKANIEMLYLVNETYKHLNKSFTIKFGNPISYETFNSSKKSQEWAKWVKEQAYALNGISEVPN